jgi:hypothetical protein
MPRIVLPTPLALASKRPAHTFSTSQRAVAAKALLHLAARCDGAERLDHSGFNSLHAQSDRVADLVREAGATGTIAKERMPKVMRVLRHYAKTQLRTFAAELWPTTAVVSDPAEAAALFIRVLRERLGRADGRRRIGWLEEGYVHLLPAQSYTAARGELALDGILLEVSERALVRELIEPDFPGGCEQIEAFDRLTRRLVRVLRWREDALLIDLAGRP